MSDEESIAYEVAIATDVDEDGDYRARLFRNGVVVRVLFAKDRDELLAKAERWAEFDRNRDTSEETFQL